MAPPSLRLALDFAWPGLLRIPFVVALGMFVVIQVQLLVSLQQEVLKIDGCRLDRWRGAQRIGARWARPILLVVLVAHLQCLRTAGSGS